MSDDKREQISRLLQKEHAISMLFTEMSQFRSDDSMDDIIADTGSTSNLIPNFGIVLKRMNQLLKITDFNEFVEEVTDSLSTVWAFENILMSQSREDLEALLESRLKKAKIKQGWTEDEYALKQKDIKRILMLHDHVITFLANMQQNDDDQKKAIDEQSELKKQNGKKKNGDPSIS